MVLNWLLFLYEIARKTVNKTIYFGINPSLICASEFLLLCLSYMISYSIYYRSKPNYHGRFILTQNGQLNRFFYLPKRPGFFDSSSASLLLVCSLPKLPSSPLVKSTITTFPALLMVFKISCSRTFHIIRMGTECLKCQYSYPYSSLIASFSSSAFILFSKPAIYPFWQTKTKKIYF